MKSPFYNNKAHHTFLARAFPRCLPKSSERVLSINS
ncbi:unnamed protein product, partial [Rotaria sp. Silwood1]